MWNVLFSGACLSFLYIQSTQCRQFIDLALNVHLNAQCYMQSISSKIVSYL